MGKVKVCDPAPSRALEARDHSGGCVRRGWGITLRGGTASPSSSCSDQPWCPTGSCSKCSSPSALIFLPLPWQEPLSSALAWPLSLILGVIQHCILQPQIKITGPDSALSPEHFDPYLAPPQHFSLRPAEPHQLSLGCAQHPKFHPSAVYSSSLPGQAGGQGSPWPCAATLLLLGWLLTADTPNWGLPASLGAG